MSMATGGGHGRRGAWEEEGMGGGHGKEGRGRRALRVVPPSPRACEIRLGAPDARGCSHWVTAPSSAERHVFSSEPLFSSEPPFFCWSMVMA